MKRERRLALTQAGGKDIPFAAQCRLLKLGFLYVILLFFYRAPRPLCDCVYRLLSRFVFDYG